MFHFLAKNNVKCNSIIKQIFKYKAVLLEILDKGIC